MAVYVLSEVEILDHELMEAYRKRAAASIEKYGGRYLVRGGASELMEGGPSPKALVLGRGRSVGEALPQSHVGPERDRDPAVLRGGGPGRVHDARGARGAPRRGPGEARRRLDRVDAGERHRGSRP